MRTGQADNQKGDLVCMKQAALSTSKRVHFSASSDEVGIRIEL